MNNWNQFLATQLAGAQFAPDTAMVADGFVAAITSDGVIGIDGDDAASFLHNQLTNDVEHLTASQVRLAGYCTPKGRLLASFLMWRDDTTIFLQLPRAIQAPVQKRLQMFVMRAKAKLHDVSDAGDDTANLVMLGMGGTKAGAALAVWFPDLPGAPYQKIDNRHGTLLRLADAFGAPRYQWLTGADSAIDAWPQLTTSLRAASDDAWRLSAVHAGVPQIGAGTQEQFVPQMINYELLGGVNFKKGCYPGQEIVARSQYLGKLKRRTTLVTIAAPLAKAGDEVFAVSDPQQPCGMIVNAAPNGAGGVDALVEMKLAAIEQGQTEPESVRLGSFEGAPLAFLAMPYALDALDL